MVWGKKQKSIMFIVIPNVFKANTKTYWFSKYLFYKTKKDFLVQWYTIYLDELIKPRN